ncbi:MAG: hypothetical protein ACYTF0_07325, partial [Planctomycetota bacterium]
MANRKPANRRRKNNSNSTFFVLAAILAAAAGGLIFAPDLLRSALGEAPATPEPGPQPTVTHDAAGVEGGAAADHEVAMPEREVDLVQVEAAPTVPEIDDTPAKAAVSYDDERGSKLLSSARDTYRGLDWDGTRRLTLRARDLKLSPEMRAEFQQLAANVDSVEEVFEKLDTKDELVRGLDSHPLLVSVSYRGRTEQVVPITDMRSKDIPTTDDGPKWLERQLKARRKAAVLTADKGIAFELKATEVTDISAVDVAAITSTKRDEFEQRLTRLTNSGMAKDALAWYEAAKFAFRNRLDDVVTDLLDQALSRDPFLATSIR